MSDKLAVTKRTRVRRIKERANYEREAIFSMLDDALFGTIAFYDGESVHAIPTLIWREANYLYIHGSNGSRLLKFLKTGAQVCVSVTNIHGLVLARSAMKHSMNYSSVCIYGVFEAVDESTKKEKLEKLFVHFMPDRWEYVRQPDKNELAATTILRIPLTEAVLKARKGFAHDDEADMQQPVWAGVIPLLLQWQTPEQEPEQTEKSKIENRIFVGDGYIPCVVKNSLL